MSTETTTTAVAATTKAAKKVADVVAEITPVVTETEEVVLAVEVPTEVVLNKPLLIVGAVVVTAGVAAGGYFGWKKFQQIKAKKAAAKIVDESAEVASEEKPKLIIKTSK